MTARDLPTPKFRIGDTIWIARTDSEAAQLPCPDCLNTRNWKVITPAGAELTAVCQRCGPYTQDRGLPSLTYQKWTGYTRALTVGSVRIDTGDTAHPVSYMCNETGVGSGSIYYEGTVYASGEAAMAAADLDAQVKNAKVREEPTFMTKQKFSNLFLKDALLENAEKAATASWWLWRHLISSVKEHVEEPGGTLRDLKAELQWDLEFYQAQHYTPDLERILQALAANDLEAAREAAKTLLDLHAEAVHAHEDAKPAPKAEEDA